MIFSIWKGVSSMVVRRVAQRVSPVAERLHSSAPLLAGGTGTVPSRRQYSIYEDLSLPKEPEIPEYADLVFTFKSYDYVPLEAFARHAHKEMERLVLPNDMYPMPHRSWSVKLYKPRTTVAEKEYSMDLYERVIRVQQAPCTTVATLCDALQQLIPPAVEMTVQEYNEEDEHFRYVPDQQLIDLKQSLEDMDSGKVAKKNKGYLANTKKQ